MHRAPQGDKAKRDAVCSKTNIHVYIRRGRRKMLRLEDQGREEEDSDPTDPSSEPESPVEEVD